MKLASELSVVLELAGTESLGRSHLYVTPEHLLFGLLHDPRSLRFYGAVRRQPTR